MLLELVRKKRKASHITKRRNHEAHGARRGGSRAK